MTLSFTSCQKEALEEVVYSKLTADLAFTTGENAQAAVNGMYATLHSLYREPMWQLNDTPTDVAWRSYCTEWLNDEAAKTDNIIADCYQNFSLIYSRANAVLDNIPKMDDALFGTGEVSSKEIMLAEAHFMRAFAYYQLTDIYYQVPLITSSEVDASQIVSYAPIADIEALIESDLKAAVPDLPKKWDNTQAQRPTTGAAEAFLVRLYMRQAGRARLAGDNGTATDKWNAALTEVNKVLAMEGDPYVLYPDVWTVFDPSTDEALYNDELIWAVRASRNITEGSWDIGLMCTPWELDMGWSCQHVSLEMYWMFDPADTRLTKLTVTEYPDIYGESVYYKAPANLNEVAKVKVEDYDQTVENNFISSQKFKFLYTWEYKYDTPNNFPVVRFSDMILCKAEILNELNGPTAEAVNLINRVRSRAFNGDSHNYTAGQFASKDALRDAICDERAMEFNSEALRRPDLIRMGLWKDRYDKYVKSQKDRAAMKATNSGQPAGTYDNDFKAYPTDLTENDIRRYFPLPQRELELNPDLKNARTF